MPIYDYKCKQCGEKFEAYRPFSGKDKDVKCPKCGAESPEKQFSVFTPRSAGGNCVTPGAYRNT